MKALVYHGPGKRQWDDVPKPTIQAPTDAIVKITTTTICGTDLHILRGHVPAVESGRILGHEGIGVVEEVGDAVENLKAGDKVLISAVTADGRCDRCKVSLYAHCRNGGWILGHLIDGTQAEYVRLPFAETSAYKLDPGVDEEAMVMLSDILPTGFEIGVLNGKVRPGDTVVIVGAGPIGLATLITAHLYGPAEVWMVDLDDNRLNVAKQWGATKTFNAGDKDLAKKIMELTNGDGVEVAIEAVGVPSTWDLCQQIVAPGGHIANVGVHGKPVEFDLDTLWIRNITVTTGLVSTYSIPTLMRMLLAKKLETKKMVTHRFPLQEAMKAYDTFESAAKEQAIKVILKA